MFSISGRLKIYYCRSPINLHRSFDGLPGAVQQYLHEDPLSGHLFVFFNRRFTMVKILCWDGDGYSIWSKRLVRGTFHLPHDDEGKITLNIRELQAILYGIKPQMYYERFSLKKF